MSPMKRAVLVEPQQIVMEETDDPTPAAGEVVISVAACGICGTDLHAYRGKHPSITCPIVPGHEFSGRVAAAGEGVRERRPGDRVAAQPSIACGSCRNCRDGRPNICSNLRVLGCQVDGAMCERIAVPADLTLPLADSVSFVDATLVEPLAVAVHAARRGGVRRGFRAVILGAGPVGLFLLQALKGLGAASVGITDIVDARLRTAGRLGADWTANPDRDDLRAAIASEYGEQGADAVFECSGSENALNQAVDLSRKGGRVVLVGMYEEPQKLANANYLHEHELDLLGSLLYIDADFRLALELIERKAVSTEPLITHRFSLDQAAQAFETVDKKRDEVVKACITIGE